MASPPPNSATPNGHRRRRSAALRLPVDSADTAQLPCEFRWTSPLPLNSPAIPSGRRFTAQQPCNPQRMPSTLPGSSSIPPQRMPASLSLAVPVAPASALSAPYVSLLLRRTVPCQLRVKRRAVCSPQRLNMAMNRRRVFPERPRTGKRTLRGNISPLCIQIKLIMARIDPHVFVLPCKMPLGNTSSEDLAVKGRYFRPKPPNHA